MKILEDLRKIVPDLNITIYPEYSSNSVFGIIADFGVGASANKQITLRSILTELNELKDARFRSDLRETTSNYNDKALIELEKMINELPQESGEGKSYYKATYGTERFTIQKVTTKSYQGKPYPSSEILLTIRNLNKIRHLSMDKPFNSDYEIHIKLTSNSEGLVGSAVLVQKPSNCGSCQITRFKIEDDSRYKGLGCILLQYCESLIQDSLGYTLVECSGVAVDIESFLIKNGYTCYTRYVNKNSDNVVGHYLKNLRPESVVEQSMAKESGYYKNNPHFDPDTENNQYLGGDDDDDD